MKISRQAQKEGNTLFNLCKTNSELDAQKVLKAVDLLIEKKPRSWCPILVHLKNRVRLELTCKTVTVESAIELTESEKTQISATIQRDYPNAPLSFVFRTVANLLGGLKVQIGWKVFDSTVRTRLESILNPSNL